MKLFPFSHQYVINQYNYLKKKIPSFNLLQLKNRIVGIVYSQKKVIGFTAVISFCLVLFIGWTLQIRSNFIASIKTAGGIVSNELHASPTLDVNLSNLSNLDLSILGTSDSLGNSDSIDIPYTYPTSASMLFTSFAPLPTYPPVPTFVPYITTVPTSAPDCSGTPTAYNSQAIVASSNSQVNNPVTIEIQLLDCHNNLAPVSDNLTVALVNSDGTARINGTTSPLYIQAQNGKVTFTVNSQINITDAFTITDTTRQFNVTDPHNRNPMVTFINNSTGNPNCTTALGVPNFWYSGVYPASIQMSSVGNAFSFNVQIKDCNKNIVSSDESLNISLISGDSSATVNGHSLPYSITAHSGQINLSVNSQNAGMVTFIIHDSTSSFDITDSNNHNPGVNFTYSLPISTPVPTSIQTNISPTQTSVSTPTTQPQPTPTVNPAPTADITLHPIPT
jgi:hypothetical protein